MKYQRTSRELLILTIFAAVSWSPAVSAKTPPSEVPVLDSPRYWDEHTLSCAKVQKESQGNDVTVMVLENFSAKPPWKPGEIVKLADATIEPRHPFNYSPPKLENIDYVFVATEVLNGEKYTAVWRPERNEFPQLLESCRIIGEIRAARDPAAGLDRAVKAADPLAERYTLHALQATDLKKADAKIIELAKAIRADRGLDLKTRLAAGDLLDKAAVARGEKKDDWEWIAETLRNEKSLELEAMRQLTARLLTNNRDQRLRTIDLISQLATEPGGPARRRAALLMAGSIENTIGGDEPADPGNVKITDLACALLADKSPMVRMAAAYTLWQTSNALRRFMDSGQWIPMISKSGAALGKAAEEETVDLQLQGQLTHYQKMVNEMAGK